MIYAWICVSRWVKDGFEKWKCAESFVNCGWIGKDWRPIGICNHSHTYIDVCDADSGFI